MRSIPTVTYSACAEAAAVCTPTHAPNRPRRAGRPLGWFAVVLALLLAAGPARGEWVSHGESEIRLDGNGNSWVVRATLNGRLQGRFLLDTGASVCVLSPDAARRLGVTSRREVELHTANGVVHAPVVELGSVEIGGNRAQGVTAVVHPGVPQQLDGIIGLSFLNRFSYGIEPGRRILRLR
jgi:clan AA aspartic protease (TIGR02281 family)